MGLFRKKKKVVEEDKRTEIEKSFEEKGQKVGLKTGEIVQKSVDKLNELKEKYNADEKIEKVKELKDKSVDKVDELVEKAKTKVGEVVEKVKNKPE